MQLHFSDHAYYSLLDVTLHLINKGPSRTRLLRQLYMCPERKKRCWGREAQGGEGSAGILLWLLVMQTKAQMKHGVMGG